MNNSTSLTAQASLVPAIARARGWRLYTEDGRRLVDLWQAGGRALFGHTPPRVTREFKNTFSRGLAAAYPSRAARHFQKALCTLFPSAQSYCLSAGAATVAASAPVWRPFSHTEEAAALAAPVFRPVLPWPLAPDILVYTVAGATAAGEPAGAIAPPLVPPPILAGTTRMIYTLLAHSERGESRFPAVEAALAACAPRWRRTGIYLYYTGGTPPAVFKAFLAGGFLLPPAPEEALILPGELSAGEEARLAALLRSV